MLSEERLIILMLYISFQTSKYNKVEYAGISGYGSENASKEAIQLIMGIIKPL
jgi:hypothetical protein